jgi:hypothetical protein
MSVPSCLFCLVRPVCYMQIVTNWKIASRGRIRITWKKQKHSDRDRDRDRDRDHVDSTSAPLWADGESYLILSLIPHQMEVTNCLRPFLFVSISVFYLQQH